MPFTISKTYEFQADFMMYLNAIQVSEDLFVDSVNETSLTEFFNRIRDEYIEEMIEEFDPDSMEELVLHSSLRNKHFERMALHYLRSYFELFSKEN